ncbi:hypothetical protein PFISCL1PPCAC_22190, partial [Pristionchus fissidentatus]
ISLPFLSSPSLNSRIFSSIMPFDRKQILTTIVVILILVAALLAHRHDLIKTDSLGFFVQVFAVPMALMTGNVRKGEGKALRTFRLYALTLLVSLMLGVSLELSTSSGFQTKEILLSTAILVMFPVYFSVVRPPATRLTRAIRATRATRPTHATRPTRPTHEIAKFEISDANTRLEDIVAMATANSAYAFLVSLITTANTVVICLDLLSRKSVDTVLMVASTLSLLHFFPRFFFSSLNSTRSTVALFILLIPTGIAAVFALDLYEIVKRESSTGALHVARTLVWIVAQQVIMFRGILIE